MYKYRASYRVCYADIDRMGYMYYGAYARVLEIARVEAIRNLGISYAELEDSGVILPVRNYSIKFIQAAVYDDLLSIEAVIPLYPDAYRLEFQYKIFSSSNILLSRACVELYILDAASRKPRVLPKALLETLSSYFNL